MSEVIGDKDKQERTGFAPEGDGTPGGQEGAVARGQDGGAGLGGETRAVQEAAAGADTLEPETTEAGRASAGTVEAGKASGAAERVSARQAGGQKGEPISDQYAETFRELSPGEIIEGRVVQVGDDEVLVDVGFKSEGRIPLNELGLRPGQTPRDILKEGDRIAVQVLRVEDSEGTVVLSRKRAQYRQAWKELEELHKAGKPVEAKVTERVKGGLLVDVGVRGFVPASHVDRNFVENLDQYVGQTLRMKILELDRQRNNVVLSRKELLEEEYEQAKARAFATLQENQVVTGVVRRLTDFGAFVDIGGGVEGLLHVSELAWSRVRHPSDVLREGQEIRVKVLKVDRENERISLSLKGTLPDPWLNIEERYQVGDLLTGTVTRVVDFGAFVKLEDGVEGLVHISQMADHHVDNPHEIVSPGSQVMVTVVSLDPQARRIGLSMKEAQRRQNPSKQAQKKDVEEAYSTADEGARETVQLGELHTGLGELFERMKEEESKGKA